MPTYEITAPDGRKFRVTAPEGASKEEALSMVQSQMQQPPQAVKLGAEGLPDAIKQVSQEFGPLSKVAIGGAGAVNRMAMRLKQLLGRELTPQDLQGLKEYEALNDASGAAVAGDIGMNLLATARAGMGLQAGATGLASKVLPSFAAKTAGAAAAGGTMASATNPVLQGDSELANFAIGAAGGAAGDLAGRGLSRVVRPITPNADVKKLVSEGVIPNPGKAAGGFISRIEQSLESLPLVGHIIKAGDRRSVEELNRAAINRSLPNGQRIAEVGRAALQKADEIFDDGYRTALDGVKVMLGSGLDDAVSRVKGNQELFLDEASEKNLGKLVDGIKSQFRDGEITGEVAKKIDSRLGSISRKFTASSDAGQREFGSAVKEVQASFRQMLADGAGGEKAAALKELNSQYARFLRVQRASGYLGNKDGVFSASQLQSAVKASDPSRNKGAFARGEALMQDLSDPAARVLGNSVPDSGTPGRLLTAAGLTGAGIDTVFGSPGYLTALAASPLLYSRAGSRYMLGDFPGQAVTADALQELAPYLAQFGRASALRQ